MCVCVCEREREREGVMNRIVLVGVGCHFQVDQFGVTEITWEAFGTDLPLC